MIDFKLLHDRRFLDTHDRLLLPKAHRDLLHIKPGDTVQLTLSENGKAIIVTKSSQGVPVNEVGMVAVPPEFQRSLGVTPPELLDIRCISPHEIQATKYVEEIPDPTRKLQSGQERTYAKLHEDGTIELYLPLRYALDLRPKTFFIRQELSDDLRSVSIAKAPPESRYASSEYGTIFFAHAHALNLKPGDYLELYCDEDKQIITATKKKLGCAHCGSTTNPMTRDDLWCDECEELCDTIMSDYRAEEQWRKGRGEHGCEEMFNGRRSADT